MTIASVLRQHRFVVLVALAVAVVYGSDHLLQLRQIPWAEYEPTTIASALDAAVSYYPRAKAVFHGDLLVGDLNVAEHAESPAYLSILNPIVMGEFAKLMGSMKLGVVVSDFLFPTIAFLLCYWFLFALSQRKLLSLLAASFFVFSPGLPWVELRTLTSPPIFSFPFDRIDYPKMTMGPFLAAALATLFALRGGRMIAIVLAGFFAGVLFYTDLYDWVTFWTGLGILLLWFAAMRDWTRVKALGAIIGIGLVISIGYWMNFVELTQLPQYQDIVTRVGVERSHGVRLFTWWLYLRVAIVAALLWLLWRTRDRISTVYLLALLLPIFVTLNLQVLIGVVPQPDHWARPLEPFLYGALTLIALGLYERFLQRIPLRVWSAGAVVLLVALFGVESYYQATRGDLGLAHDLFKGTETIRAHHRVPAAGAASYRWMEAQLPPGAVVGSIAPATNLDLQLYTNARLFLPFGANTVASNDEIWQRFFSLASRYQLPEDRVRAMLVDDREMGLYLFQNAFYASALNSYFRGSSQAAPRAVVDAAWERYHGAEPSRFRLDYLYYGPNERALGAEDPIESLSNLERVYEDAAVKIYKL